VTLWSSWYVRFALVLIAAAALQMGIFAHLRVVGVAPDLLLALAVAGGLVGGEWRGSVTGALAGLTLDLLVYGRPFGLGMLVFTLIGFLVGRYQASSVRRSSGGDALVAALAAVVAVLAYDLGGRMFAGSPVLAGSLPVVALVLAGWTALVAIPARWVMGWVWGSPERVSAWAR
jgi:rod shape-determining protein MreD